MPHDRTPNIPIGTCPCPVCKADVPLHKYRAYSEHSARSRRAGKLYLLCPTDGMFQGQEYLLENGHITNAAPAAEPAPEPTPEPIAEPAPEPAPETAPEPKKNDAWGFF